MAKKFGGGIILATSESEYAHPAWLNTGNLALNLAINFTNAGLPTANIVENFGDSATGKSILAYHLLKDTIDKDGIAVLIDMESAFTPKLGKSLGIDMDKLIIIKATTNKKLNIKSTNKPTKKDKAKAKVEAEEVKEAKDLGSKTRPLCIEEVFQRVESLMDFRTKQYGKDHLLTMVWDSIGNTNPVENLAGDRPDLTRGVVAKRVGNWIQRVSPTVSDSNTSLFLVNTVYTNVTTTPTAEPLKTKHGKSIGFNSQIRIQWLAKLGKAGKICDSRGNESGARLYFKIVKNREQRPWITGTVDWNFSLTEEPTMDYYSGLLNFLIKYGKLEKARGCVKIGESSYKCRAVTTNAPIIYEADVKVIEKMLEEHPELLKP